MTAFAAAHLDTFTYADGPATARALAQEARLAPSERQEICDTAIGLVRQIRAEGDPGLMEVFLAEYGLSTQEGVALMCLAEALLRVPDAETIDDLIEDKIAPSDWDAHLGHSTSSLVNASTWALMLTGRVLDDHQPGIVGALKGAIKRLGEPVIRTAVARAMREMGQQFVLGEDIARAMVRAGEMQAQGFTYSYDMLGEAAMTEADAQRYHLAYSRAISEIADHCTGKTVAENPGISVKLSALHPRYEVAQRDAVMRDLVPRVRSLAMLAKSAGMGFHIDAEEADRLPLSLDIIEDVLSEPALSGWSGFGVVVQAYGQRASHVIDYLSNLSKRLDRRIMVRLVKGAYWDTEVKRAQVAGMPGFPVFTNKAHTDVSYIANARKLLEQTDHLYPQFATHNAHTICAILHLAESLGVTPAQFEFQRLHGMGEVLHKLVLKQFGTRCRIYAPVGAHKDLLAYLVRRLLENGANSSFVNQIVDADVPAETVAACPFDAMASMPKLPTGPDLFQPERKNSRGFDLSQAPDLSAIENAWAPALNRQWTATSHIAANVKVTGPAINIINPANPSDLVGKATVANSETIERAFGAATIWEATANERAGVLDRAADLYEDRFGDIFALLTREAGKTRPDAVAELREAVDFLRYYAAQARRHSSLTPRGTWVCISPWNFPLAIFTGQIAAALAAGNAVIAKPAEQTTLIADVTVRILHEAGVPAETLQLVLGGPDIGAGLTKQSSIAGVAFTGSTPTAQAINRSLAEHAAPGTPLIAETGGLNAMIVDSTALPEAAVRDIVNGAFRSAGQRCSALRCLYVQEDVAEQVITMLKGAMDVLQVGDSIHLSTDVGPVIDAAARAKILDHVTAATEEGRVLHQLAAPDDGTFVGPTLIRVDSIQDLKEEIFGPVLHVATFSASALDKIVQDINGTGFGLTFGLHTRIDDRVEKVTAAIDAGNIYVNRDQIGAIVGSQPFGGTGLSGTGPKAGGPNYVPRFGRGGQTTPPKPMTLPGPTGEANRLRYRPRGPILCLGPKVDDQVAEVRQLGGIAVTDDPENTCAAVIWRGDAERGREIAKALAARTGPISPLLTEPLLPTDVLHEVHVCIDTTAAGGNADLLAHVAQDATHDT